MRALSLFVPAALALVLLAPPAPALDFGGQLTLKSVVKLRKRKKPIKGQISPPTSLLISTDETQATFAAFIPSTYFPVQRKSARKFKVVRPAADDAAAFAENVQGVLDFAGVPFRVESAKPSGSVKILKSGDVKSRIRVRGKGVAPKELVDTPEDVPAKLTLKFIYTGSPES